MITEIYIEGEKLDLHEDEQITVRSSVQNVQDISKLFADFSQSFTVPASDTNNGIFSHWYNANIDGGFDARTRVQSTIDVQTLDFKRGKMRLDKVEIKNGEPSNYRITFFGDVIKVKDLIGDDKLPSLTWLDGFNHSYNAANVLIGLTTGLDFTVDSILYEEAIIYPLISYSRQYLYDTDITDATSTTSLVNIAYLSSRTDGVSFTELKPSIKLSLVVEAIQQKYGFTFTGNFFSSSEFTDAYMNLNNSTESLANGVLQYETKSGTTVGETAASNDRLSYNTVITPDGAFLDTEYKIKLTINGTTVYESPNYLKGVNDKTGALQLVPDTYDVTATIITEVDFTFDATTLLQIVYPGPSNNIVYEDNSYSSQSIVLTTTIVNELQDIKTFDFLTSLFKTFNLIITPDGEDIQIEDLQSWYSSGAIHEISQYIDTSTETIGRGKIHREINFKFQESDQILADEFKQNNKQVYGNLEFKLVDGSGNELADVDGDILDIEVDFENPIFERLSDLNTTNETTIQYCPYFNRDIKPIAGNLFLFYAPSVSVASNTIGYDGSTYSEISTNIYMPSHAQQIDTESFNLNFNSEINEYTGSIFENTIFFKYYEDYITDIFSIKRRIYNYKGILPNSLLNTLKLNDRLVIRDTRFIINSINSNIVVRMDDLELINDIYDAPLASDLLSGSTFVPTSQLYNSEARSSTAKYVGLTGKTIAAVDTGDGTGWLTITESTTTSSVMTINFSITINETGSTRNVQIQVTDGLNDPKFTILQNTVFNPSFDFSDFRNTQMLPTIFLRT